MPTYVQERMYRPWRSITASSTDKKALVGDRINANTASAQGGSFTLLLPTPSTYNTNDEVIIRDPQMDFSTTSVGWDANNLIIDPGVNVINGLPGTIICDVRGAILQFRWSGGGFGWAMYVLAQGGLTYPS